MPARLIDLAPGGSALLKRLADGEERVDRVPIEDAPYLEILHARNLIEIAKDGDGIGIVRLSEEGRRLYEEGHIR